MDALIETLEEAVKYARAGSLDFVRMDVVSALAQLDLLQGVSTLVISAEDDRMYTEVCPTCGQVLFYCACEEEATLDIEE